MINDSIVRTQHILSDHIDANRTELLEKLDRFAAILEKYVSQGAIIAFSGGVDSAFLVWAAKKISEQIGGRILALTTQSASTPDADLKDAVQFAKNLGVMHRIEKSNEFNDPRYLVNDDQRCYYCKSELFRITSDIALSDEYRWVLYGYNASDQGDFRPGHRAAIEHKVAAPLFEAGLDKAEIREVLRANKIELAEKPASPCLSSRIMTGIRIADRHLEAVAVMEGLLREARCRVYRVRLCQTGEDYFLRIETHPDEFSTVLSIKEKLVAEGRKRGYRWVVLDLEGYKTGGGNL